MVVIGPDDDYLAEIVGEGGLGDSEAFRNVVREAERAGAVVFVNFDAGATGSAPWPRKTPTSRRTSSRSRASGSAPGRTVTPATAWSG